MKKAYRIGEIICKPYNWWGINISNIQGIPYNSVAKGYQKQTRRTPQMPKLNNGQRTPTFFPKMLHNNIFFQRYYTTIFFPKILYNWPIDV